MAQKFQTSSAEIGLTFSSSAGALDCAVNITVCIVIAAIRFGLTSDRSLPAAAASSISSANNAISGACATRTSVGCEMSSCGAKSVKSGRLAVGIGPRKLEQQLNCHLEPVQRIGLPGSGRADLVGGPAQRILEECQQEFVLAVELQIETAQRLP